MILYDPLDGDVIDNKIKNAPRTCFLMTKLGKPISPELIKIRQSITDALKRHDYKIIDASSKVTGRDYLLKIWKSIASTPLSIAIAAEDLSPETQWNIYYELGIAQALGKETVIVKAKGIKVPTDFGRTEYIEYEDDFNERIDAYMKSLEEQAEHYIEMVSYLKKNPVLAIDYLKRAYLLTGKETLKTKAKKILKDNNLEKRAKNSIEVLAASF